MAAEKPEPPSTPDAARAAIFRWARFISTGLGVAIEAAVNAKPGEEWSKANDAVILAESVAAQLRIARDCLPSPQGTAKDQFVWLKELMTAQTDAQVGALKTVVRDVSATSQAVGFLVERLEKLEKKNGK